MKSRAYERWHEQKADKPDARRCLHLVPVVVMIFFAACAGSTGSHSGDSSIYCENESQCPSGYTCVGNVCVPEGDASLDANPGTPNIVVEPTMLDFGSPIAGAEVNQDLTIHNTGDGDLQIVAMNLIESGQTPEYSVGTLSKDILPPNDSVEVRVTLRPTDTELDIGQLLITSNDPDEATVRVDLVSSFKGDPNLTFCVLTGLAPPDDCADPMVVDFGTIPYGNSETREFFVRNDGTGNNMLVVEDVLVNVSPSHPMVAALYDLELFEIVPDPNNPNDTIEQPVTPPYNLNPAGGGQPANELRGRLTFTADTDGFLLLQWDALEVVTTSTVNPDQVTSAAPIYGEIDGCPPDLYDINHDKNDGCEYACAITNGGVEICDSLDNDCNGITDDMSGICYTGGDNGCQPDGTNCVGICSPGVWACQGSQPVCVGQVVAEASEQCDALDHDCNGDPINDLDPEGGDTCATANARNTRPDDGSSEIITGNITLGSPEDVDWYAITFSDSYYSSEPGGCDDFDIDISFVQPPGGGNFRFDVYNNEACTASPVCQTGTNTGLREFTWHSHQDCNCASHGQCVNNSMTLRIKVYKEGGPICETYQLRVKNGS